ncbi:MAG: hypothetical protein LC808_03205 [Actinobacteria bacterium]|nr:hypothetical protein [Actinomycetota bacterium]
MAESKLAELLERAAADAHSIAKVKWSALRSEPAHVGDDSKHPVRVLQLSKEVIPDLLERFLLEVRLVDPS